MTTIHVEGKIDKSMQKKVTTLLILLANDRKSPRKYLV